MEHNGFPKDIVITCKNREQANQVFDLLEQSYSIVANDALRELDDKQWRGGCILIHNVLVGFMLKSSGEKYGDPVVKAEDILG